MDVGTVLSTGFAVGVFLVWVEVWMWALAKVGMPFACYVDKVGGSS